MAVLRGAYMTPEAEDICVAMALASEAAFDRLAKAQVSESTGAAAKAPQAAFYFLGPPPVLYTCCVFYVDSIRSYRALCRF